VIDTGFEYRVEKSGEDDTGMKLYAIYKRLSEDVVLGR